jgi:hypothetical protein
MANVKTVIASVSVMVASKSRTGQLFCSF